MKKFLALYIGTASPEEKATTVISEDIQKEGMAAWGNWMARHAAAIVDAGSPLGKTMKASPEGVSSTRNNVAGYVIVQADSHDAAAKMFEGHPHFTIFPGHSVEIVECLAMPGAEPAE